MKPLELSEKYENLRLQNEALLSETRALRCALHREVIARANGEVTTLPEAKLALRKNCACMGEFEDENGNKKICCTRKILCDSFVANLDNEFYEHRRKKHIPFGTLAFIVSMVALSIQLIRWIVDLFAG